MAPRPRRSRVEVWKRGAHVAVGYADLQDVLARRVGGEVRFDRGTRLAYSTDASNYRQVPIGVVAPRDADDVLATLDACREVGAPVLPRGAGTSLAGQACNVAVVLDFTRHMDRVLDVDPDRRSARVQPGVVLDALQMRARPHGLRFGPDPATHGWCTLGGMIGNNAAGAHSLRDGTTVRHVRSLTVATYRGQTIRITPNGWDGLPESSLRSDLEALRADAGERIGAGFAPIPRRVSGYNLDALLGDPPHVARSLVGSEGTCAVFLEAEVDLVPAIAARALVVLPYPDIVTAARDVARVLEYGPIALEGIERRLLDAAGPAAAGLLQIAAPEPPGRGGAGNGAGGAYLIAEFEGADAGEAEARARAAAAVGRGASVLVDDRSQAAVWSAREAALGSSSRALGGRTLFPGWEDSSVHPLRLGDYLQELQALLAAHGLAASLYGHFGEGCVHGRISFDFQSRSGIAAFRRFMEEAAQLVTGLGGSLSGEHGDGQARGELLAVQFGPALVEDFRRFKRIWDPDNGLNPGKLADARPLDESLRGAGYASDPTTHRSPRETAELKIARACVGAGRCLQAGQGVMCPSYRASHNETETTRGRARLLFELASGEVDPGDRKAVGEALLTCLGCKACKTECPAGVDMAEAKSLFNARRYEGRLRPRVTMVSAFAPWLLRAPTPLRSLAAMALRRPRLGVLAGRMAGFEPGCVPPTLARETFTAWFARRAEEVREEGTTSYLMAPAGSCSAPRNGSPGASQDREPNGSPGASQGREPNGSPGASHGRERNGSPGPRSGMPTESLARPMVLLWPDTFHNHFAPEALVAAARLLWARGATVVVPAQPVCCGRTLVDGGFRDQAFGTLAAAAGTIADAPAGTWMAVILEPSCLAMFRDEWRAIGGAGRFGEPGPFPSPSEGHGAMQTMSLAEALEALPPEIGGEPDPHPGSRGPALLHGHCHQTSLWGVESDARVLVGAGYAVSRAPEGCCGMAGAFGLDRRTAALGRAVGELGLLPAVRGHRGLVVASGISCREQIRRQAGVRAVHLAEALWQSRPTGTDR